MFVKQTRSITRDEPSSIQSSFRPEFPRDLAKSVFDRVPTGNSRRKVSLNGRNTRCTRRQTILSTILISLARDVNSYPFSRAEEKGGCN